MNSSECFVSDKVRVASRNNDGEQYIRELTATRFSNTPEKCSRGGVGHFEHRPHLSLSVSALVVHGLVDPDSSHMLVHALAQGNTCAEKVLSLSRSISHGCGARSRAEAFGRGSRRQSMLTLAHHDQRGAAGERELQRAVGHARDGVHHKTGTDLRGIREGIFVPMDTNLDPAANTGEPKVFYYKTETIEENASKLDGNCAALAPEWEELQRLRAEGLVAIRDTNKLLNDCDELIPKWFNVVRSVVDSEDLPLNVYRETLLRNKISRVVKKNYVTKCLEILAEIAELNDDRNKSYEPRGKCSNFSET